MRAAVFVLCVAGTGCGLALDFDPSDPPDFGRIGMDGGGEPDLGAPHDGGRRRDAAIDGGTIEIDAAPIEAGSGDASTVCFSSSDCSVVTAEVCDVPDFSCGAAGVCAPRPGTCMALVAPVCGCDGVDYVNACLAHAAGTSAAFTGTCEITLDGGGPDSCGFVTTLDQSCVDDASCIVGIHQTSCCGSTTAVGINATEHTRFGVLEPLCDASYPVCGCPTGPTLTDSGETTLDPSTIRVGCIARGPRNVCLTYVTMRPPDGP